jgi:hypothetical protein
MRLAFSISFSISGLAAAIVVAATSCASLPPLGTGCGNKVIDDGEDCDGNYGDASGGVCIAPGQASQCHFSCLDSPCPAPFTCGGIDHVCRRPAGTFTTSASIAGESSRRVMLGDFDGDLAEDVVTVGATSRVHFFDGHASTEQTLLSSDSLLPALGVVTTDARTSGVVTSTYSIIDQTTQLPVTQGNVRVWRGSADRTLLPTVYPDVDLTSDKATAGRAISALRANQVGSDIFALLTINGTTLLYYITGTEPSVTPFPISPLTAPLGDPGMLAGRVAVGTLGLPTCAAAPFTACQAIALAFTGATDVEIHSTCDATFAVNVLGPNHQAALTRTLPSNDTIAGPAFLIAPSSTSAPSLYVVGAKNTYVFPPDSTGCSLDTTAVVASIPSTEKPLAIGFIDDEPTFVDWVSPTGIHVNNGSSVVLTSAPSTTVWTDAVIEDLNLNGLPDVVAVAQGSIDFYNGTGSVLLNGSHITLDGEATHMTVGDFDGDFVDDIVVSTRGDSTGLSTDSINIAFGTFTGFPAPPLSVGRLTNVQQLEPAFFDYRLTGTPDFVNTLYAIGDDSKNDLTVSILQGSPDRLINSPYFLVDGSTSLVSTAVGTFTNASPAHAGIAGLSATGAAPGLWFTPMTGDAQVDLANASTSKLPDGVTLALDQPGFDRSGLAAIDVGGAPGQELLVVQPSAFFLTHVEASGVWPSLAYEPLQNVQNGDKGVLARVADVDDDGDDDVIVEYVDGVTNKFAARIVLNAMNGTLSFTNAAAPALPDGTLAVTTIHSSKDGTTQLLSLSASGVYLAQMSNGVLGPWSASPVIDLSKLAALSTPITVHDVIAGDVDGDGVDDVVIATSKGFMVYFGDPAT